jgi:crotonobetainyl-CoA:carnitine CoA-transferase CaiB-like acyl-CoA transferase
MEHWPEIEGPYLRIVGSKSRYEWFRQGCEAGYTFAPVHSAADQLTNPQFAARGFLKPMAAGGQTVMAPGLPFAWPSAASTTTRSHK